MCKVRSLSGAAAGLRPRRAPTAMCKARSSSGAETGPRPRRHRSETGGGRNRPRPGSAGRGNRKEGTDRLRPRGCGRRQSRSGEDGAFVRVAGCPGCRPRRHNARTLHTDVPSRLPDAPSRLPDAPSPAASMDSGHRRASAASGGPGMRKPDDPKAVRLSRGRRGRTRPIGVCDACCDRPRRSPPRQTPLAWPPYMRPRGTVFQYVLLNTILPKSRTRIGPGGLGELSQLQWRPAGLPRRPEARRDFR